jgi:hypothetical protein
MNYRDVKAVAGMTAFVGLMNLTAINTTNYVQTRALLRIGHTSEEIERVLLFDKYDQLTPFQKFLVLSGTAGRKLAYLTD